MSMMSLYLVIRQCRAGNVIGEYESLQLLSGYSVGQKKGETLDGDQIRVGVWGQHLGLGDAEDAGELAQAGDAGKVLAPLPVRDGRLLNLQLLRQVPLVPAAPLAQPSNLFANLLVGHGDRSTYRPNRFGVQA